MDVKMMNWQVEMALDKYRERLIEAQRDYEISEALHDDRKGTDKLSRLLRFTGLLLAGLGNRLQ